MSRIALSFANASCAHCVRVVTRSLEHLTGVGLVRVDPMRQQILVDYDPARVSVESIRMAMERSGYPNRLAAGPTPAAPLRSSRIRAA